MLQAGIDCFELHPPSGCDLSGFAARTQPSEGTHDPVLGSTLVLSSGERCAAVVSLDLLGLEPIYSALLQTRLERELGLLGVIISCTHTHSGPAPMRLLGCGDPDPWWLASLQERVLDSARRAAASRGPVSLEHGLGTTDIGMNRRALAQGVPQHRSLLSDLEGGSPGLTDPAVPVARLRRDGAALCTLFQASCHPVTLGHDNRLVSADYPGFARRKLAEQADAWGQPIFLQGCCGDINPAVTQRGFDESRRIGESLAESVSAAPTTRAEGNPKLSWSERRLTLGYRQHPAHVQVSLAALGLGEVGLVTLPGEPFAELGIRIRERSPFPTTFVCGYSNGSVGYLPTPTAYEEGGYEVDSAHQYYGYPDCVASSTAKTLTQTALELLEECRAG